MYFSVFYNTLYLKTKRETEKIVQQHSRMAFSLFPVQVILELGPCEFYERVMTPVGWASLLIFALNLIHFCRPN